MRFTLLFMIRLRPRGIDRAKTLRRKGVGLRPRKGVDERDGWCILPGSVDVLPNSSKGIRK